MRHSIQRVYHIVIMVLVLTSFSIEVCAQFSLADKLTDSGLSESKKREIERNLQDLPTAFRKNIGQWNNEILFESASSGVHMYFMKDGISYAAVREAEDEMKAGAAAELVCAGNGHEYLVWNMKFVGCNKNVKCSSEGERKSKINYLIGNDPSRFVTNAPDYNLIKYHELYDKIEARYYSSGNKIKYDYVVKPGGKINDIRMNFEGVKKISIKNDGSLEIRTDWGTATDLAPYSYQVINGVKKEVDVCYNLSDKNTVGFYCKGYDPLYDLIIDPVILVYSTYVGAAGPLSGPLIWGYTYDIASDDLGNAYVTGWYDGAGFPTKPGNYDASYNTNTDVVVFKMRPDGTDIVYGTYIGGSSGERGYGITIDNTGNAYVTGNTGSANFPVTAGAFDVAFNAGQSQPFLLKLNAAGSALVYSTFLGDQGAGEGVVINNAGEAFVTGRINSATFPTTAGCYDNTFNGGLGDVFVTKFNAGGSAILYSTYVGGSNDATGAGTIGWNDFGGSDIGCRIALDPVGDVYVTGFTTASDFPTTPGCYDPTLNNAAGTNNGDGILFKLSLNGAGAADMKYSTYFGGSSNDQSFDIAVNAAGEAFVTGITLSNNFPTTPGSYDPSYNAPCTTASYNVFLVKMNTTGTALVYSTFVGGNGIGMSVQVNAKDQAYVNVAYPTRAIPLTGGACGTLNDVPMLTCSYKRIVTNGTGVALYKFNNTGSKLLFTAWIGGSNIDGDFGNTHISLVKNGCNEDVVMTTVTHSSDFPTTVGAFQTTKKNLQSSEDQPVVLRLSQTFNADFTVPAATCNSPAKFNNITNQCGMWDSVQTWLWDFGDGTTSNLISPNHTYAAPGTYAVKLIAICPDDTIIKSITVTGVCGMSVTAAPASVCPSACATITATGNGGTTPYTYSWSTGAITQNISLCPVSTTTYTVKITDAVGTTATTSSLVTVNPGVNVTIIPTDITCNGSTNGSAIAAGGSGTTPYTYSWSNGLTTQTITGLAPGSYTVKVTDSKGCTSTTTTAIISPPALAGLFTKGTAVCNGCGCKEWLMVTGSGGTSPYSYIWPDGYVNRYKSQLCPGTNTINIKDKNGCSVNIVVSAP